MNEWLECIRCKRRFAADEIRYTCSCGGLLSLERRRIEAGPSLFDERLAGREPLDRSGVWRFREGVASIPGATIVTHPEGATRLYRREALSAVADVADLSFKHEGENPTGSFKDRGMTVAISQAVRLGCRAVACASTGNTSASLAAYAGQAGLRAFVFIPSGKIAHGKLAQTLAYGATCLAVRGDFDDAMDLVRDCCDRLGIYLVNSINPFRIEGQKTIVWELLQDLEWNPPDWIVCPAGNLGNTSAFGKALREAREAGWIDRVPRIAAIQAAGANPFYRSFAEGFEKPHRVPAETVATAIRIGNPVSYEKAVESIRYTRGIVEQVSDQEILSAKRAIDESGIGCEPASACTLAGVRKLRAAGVMRGDERIACILTGHVLKDPDIVLQQERSDQIVEIEPSVEAAERVLRK